MLSQHSRSSNRPLAEHACSPTPPIRAASALRRATTSILLLLGAFAQPAAATESFDIPSMSLNNALNLFARQAHVHLAYSIDAVASFTAQALKGQYERDVALQMLLSGTGLEFKYLAPDSLAIRKAAEGKDGATASTEVNVAPKTGSGRGTRSGAGAGGNAVDEILVTAQRRTEPLQSVPMSISAWGTKDIERAGAVRIEDIAGFVPGVNFTESGPSSTKFNIRGVSDGINSPNDVQTTVGQYIDEMIVSINGPAPGLRLFDIERVEVLRGPQGTFYGDASVGGTIRLITNKPDTTRFSTSAQVTVSGTHDGSVNHSLDGMLNIPLSQNEAALRLVGYRADDSGYINNVTRHTRGVNRTIVDGWRASLAYEPTGQLKATITSLAQRDHTGGSYSYEPRLGDLNTGTAFAERFATSLQMHNLTLEYRSGVGELLSSTTYSSIEQAQLNDATDVTREAVGLALPTSDQNVGMRRTFVEEIRLLSPGHARLNWLTGLYYFNTNGVLEEKVTTPGAFDLLASLGQKIEGTVLDVGHDVIFRLNERRPREQYALFGDAGYRLTDTVEIRGGLRWFDTRLSQRSNPGGWAFGSTPVTPVTSTSEHKLMSRATLSYAPRSTLLWYVSASQGFRVGGLNPAAPGATPGVDFPAAFQSETLWSYELGAKTVTRDQRFTLNAACYLVDWSNIQVPVQSPRSFTFIGNIGRAHSAGAEAEVIGHPTRSVALAGNASWIDSRSQSDVPSLGAASGDRVPGVPEFSYGASIEIGMPLVVRREGLTWTVRGDYEHVGRMFSQFETARDSFGDYSLAHLRFTVNAGRWKGTLFVRNVSDQRALVNAHTASGNQRVTPVQPRTIGVSFLYDN